MQRDIFNRIMVFNRDRFGRNRSRSRSKGRSPVGRRVGATSSRSRPFPRAHSRSRSRSPRKTKFRRSRSRSASRSPMRRRPGFGRYESPPENECLGVFNLNPSTSERHVEAIFSRYGRIRDVTLIHDRVSGRSRGFGFVAFDHLVDAREARDKCNGIDLDGRKIRVDFSSTQRPHTPTPGMYMGKPSFFSSGNRDEDRWGREDRGNRFR